MMKDNEINDNFFFQFLSMFTCMSQVRILVIKAMDEEYKMSVHVTDMFREINN